jgi:hypothetical protein
MPFECGVMEGRELPGVPCLYRCSCFDEHTTDFNMSLYCSKMKGCALLAILCNDGCSCFHMSTRQTSACPLSAAPWRGVR